MKAMRLVFAAALALAASSLTGCQTGAFCFRDCEGDSDGGADGAITDANGEKLPFDGGDGECLFCDAGTEGGDACSPTNGGVETCDGLDNDCNGQIDDVDFGKPENCGTCGNDCTKLVANATAATCQFVAPGQPGHCGYASCVSDYYDVDPNTPGCEYFCIKANLNGQTVADESDPELRCNHRDDDCDGQVDEDVDVCSDPSNCGTCGRTCVVLNGNGACAHTGTATCDTSNTACQIAACDPGWVDLDGKYATGCEYHCTPTNGGVETCDDVDNDCDGLLDQFDPSLTDARVGLPCQGGADGVCGEPANAGVSACHNGQITCDGAKVVLPGQRTETCNGVDDDCNGAVDDHPSDVGQTCGALGDGGAPLTAGNCQPGTTACVAGKLQCQGSVGPQPETCNGQDDDCDGVIDDSPAQVGKSCGIAVGACKPGHYQCQSGALVCAGATTPTQELCNGIDDDCNGVIDDHAVGVGDACGSATGACKPGTKACVAGKLVCSGSVDPKAETCNGIDDDCNGNVDDGAAGTGVSCGSNVGACRAGVMLCQNAKLACVGEVKGGTEICNGIDDDCDGSTDEGVAGTGVACGSAVGACKQGTMTCQGGQMLCVGEVKPTTETCNGKDDDCDGVPDDDPAGVGGSCGSSVGTCSLGTYVCQAGTLKCNGGTAAVPETCNGQDDDCDGVVDGTAKVPNVACNTDADCASQTTAKSCMAVFGQATKVCSSTTADVGAACNVPPAAPPGATEPCKAGTFQCVAGSKTCVGSITATQSFDACGVDSNCDGQLTGQPDKTTDVHNCKTCGNDCGAGAVHANWACVASTCTFQGCQAGYYDNGGPGDAVAGDGKCGYACSFVSAAESCNGADDNCNGQIDENVAKPSTAQVCGVGFGVTDANCTTNVAVSCTAGKWQCVFPTGYCGGNGSTPATSDACANAVELCDTKDNNCNGIADEKFKRPLAQANVLNDPCTNGSKGACSQSGTFVCNGAGTATTCSVTAKTCSQLGDCTELCDGLDNDCDGLVDEPKSAPGTVAATYVKPTVTKLASSLWMYTYEASRPNANSTSSGTGNGWTCSSGSCPGGAPSAPSGVTLDATPACSVGQKVPWFNVTAGEAEQACAARGGRICSTTEWQTAAKATVSCKWGYGPRGSACTSVHTASKYCNLGYFDYDTSAAGTQNALLPTASSLLKLCYADWSSLQSNPAASQYIYDLTGNLREITKSATNTYPLMGGAFTTQSEDGAQQSFTFYSVDQTFQLYDTGFRCCFDADPSQ